jgi:hypothetical protein
METKHRWLLGALGVLFIANVIYYVVGNWGLVTIHAQDQPLGDIIRSVERQAHITLHTNVDLATPVTMYVTKVPLTDALETLSAVTESRWSLLYVVGPDSARVKEGIVQLDAPELSSDWKRVFVPIPGFIVPQLANSDAAPLDPRSMHWRVEVPTTSDLQEYLNQGAKTADVTYILPADWDPAVVQQPASGTLHSVTKKIVSSVSGRYEEFFYLQKRVRVARDGQGRQDLWQNADLLARMDERVQQQIAALPADQQAAAQQNYNDQKTFFQSLAALTPEERRAKLRDRFQNQDPDNRNDRRSPEQRAQRMLNYVQNRAAARGY